MLCHNPSGSPTAQPVSWGDSGGGAGGGVPLACTSCHVDKDEGVATRSAHVAATDPVLNRSGCETCHVMTSHMSGTAQVVGADGVVIPVTDTNRAEVDGVCKSCHDGSGKALADRPPPRLFQFDSLTGDPHGVAGNEPELSCSECHDAHASTNAYLFASEIGGVTIPDGTIDRTGVGAQRVCSACHTTQRHMSCSTNDCHDHETEALILPHATDPVPDGGACFGCHGHVQLPYEVPKSGQYCHHCHNRPYKNAPAWNPDSEFVTGPNVKTDSPTQVTVTWYTRSPTNSLVEYGQTQLDHVEGTYQPALNGSVVWHGYTWTLPKHQVAVTGLSLGTSYNLRVRSEDRWHRFIESPIVAFTVGAPPAPRVGYIPYAYAKTPLVPVLFSWYSVTSFDGHAIEYRLEISDDATFQRALFGEWMTTLSKTVSVPNGKTIYWRVMARDKIEDYRSVWSDVESFETTYWDPALD